MTLDKKKDKDKPLSTNLNQDLMLLSPGKGYTEKIIYCCCIVISMNSGILEFWRLTQHSFSYCHGLTVNKSMLKEMRHKVVWYLYTHTHACLYEHMCTHKHIYIHRNIKIQLSIDSSSVIISEKVQ